MSNIGNLSNRIVKIKELNSSFVQLRFDEMQDSQDALSSLKRALQVERAGWQYDFMVKIGRKSKYDFFFQEIGSNTLVLDSGILEIPPIQEILQLEISEQEDNPEIDEYLEDILESDILPFPPYPGLNSPWEPLRISHPF